MDVALTARKGQISKALRTQAEEGMERMGAFWAAPREPASPSARKAHIHIVELTIRRATEICRHGQGRLRPIAALREAIEHAEHQVQRHRDRRIVSSACPKAKRCSPRRR
jgi:ribosome-associated translation inhibitor RaiA